MKYILLFSIMLTTHSTFADPVSCSKAAVKNEPVIVKIHELPQGKRVDAYIYETVTNKRSEEIAIDRQFLKKAVEETNSLDGFGKREFSFEFDMVSRLKNYLSAGKFIATKGEVDGFFKKHAQRATYEAILEIINYSSPKVVVIQNSLSSSRSATNTYAVRSKSGKHQVIDVNFSTGLEAMSLLSSAGKLESETRMPFDIPFTFNHFKEVLQDFVAQNNELGFSRKKNLAAKDIVNIYVKSGVPAKRRAMLDPVYSTSPASAVRDSNILVFNPNKENSVYNLNVSSRDINYAFEAIAAEGKLSSWDVREMESLGEVSWFVKRINDYLAAKKDGLVAKDYNPSHSGQKVTFGMIKRIINQYSLPPKGNIKQW